MTTSTTTITIPLLTVALVLGCAAEVTPGGVDKASQCAYGVEADVPMGLSHGFGITASCVHTVLDLGQRHADVTRHELILRTEIDDPAKCEASPAACLALSRTLLSEAECVEGTYALEETRFAGVGAVVDVVFPVDAHVEGQHRRERTYFDSNGVPIAWVNPDMASWECGQADEQLSPETPCLDAVIDMGEHYAWTRHPEAGGTEDISLADCYVDRLQADGRVGFDATREMLAAACQAYREQAGRADGTVAFAIEDWQYSRLRLNAARVEIEDDEGVWSYDLRNVMRGDGAELTLLRRTRPDEWELGAPGELTCQSVNGHFVAPLP